MLRRLHRGLLQRSTLRLGERLLRLRHRLVLRLHLRPYLALRLRLRLRLQIRHVMTGIHWLGCKNAHDDSVQKGA